MSDVQSEMDELLDQDVESVDEPKPKDEQDIDPENPDGEQVAEEVTPEEPADGEVVVSIEGVEAEDDDDQPGDREWLKNLRKEHKAQKKRIRELEQKLQAPVGVQQEEQLGAKPTLESCDYDSETYEQKLAEWFVVKGKVEKRKEELAAKQDAEKRDWENRLNEYGRMKQELRVQDYEEAEEAVKENTDLTQQGIMVKGAQNPALLIYALGKNPKLLQEISSIKDPVKFAFAVAQLETKVKTTNQKRIPPPPERQLSGAGKPKVITKQSLADLKEDCLRKGDMNPYYRAKEKMRA